MKIKLPSETHRHCRDSPFVSPNRCISDFANAPSKLLAMLRTSDINLRRPNANDATGTFNRSRNVAPMSELCTGFNSCKGDVRSGWHRSEKNH